MKECEFIIILYYLPIGKAPLACDVRLDVANSVMDSIDFFIDSVNEFMKQVTLQTVVYVSRFCRLLLLLLLLPAAENIS